MKTTARMAGGPTLVVLLKGAESFFLRSGGVVSAALPGSTQIDQAL